MFYNIEHHWEPIWDYFMHFLSWKCLWRNIGSLYFLIGLLESALKILNSCISLFWIVKKRLVRNIGHIAVWFICFVCSSISSAHRKRKPINTIARGKCSTELLIYSDSFSKGNLKCLFCRRNIREYLISYSFQFQKSKFCILFTFCCYIKSILIFCSFPAYLSIKKSYDITSSTFDKSSQFDTRFFSS